MAHSGANGDSHGRSVSCPKFGTISAALVTSHSCPHTGAYDAASHKPSDSAAFAESDPCPVASADGSSVLRSDTISYRTPDATAIVTAIHRSHVLPHDPAEPQSNTPTHVSADAPPDLVAVPAADLHPDCRPDGGADVFANAASVQLSKQFPFTAPIAGAHSGTV